MGARRARREHDRLTLEGGAEPPRDSPPPDLDLVAALLELPDRHAAAVRLHHLEDRPIAEVAEMLGCTEGAAKILLLRARRVLAERLMGLTGRWVSEQTWTVDGVARYLASIGRSDRREAVIDKDLEGRGGRWELTVSDGFYELRRDDGARSDQRRPATSTPASAGRRTAGRSCSRSSRSAARPSASTWRTCLSPSSMWRPQRRPAVS